MHDTVRPILAWRWLFLADPYLQWNIRRVHEVPEDSHSIKCHSDQNLFYSEY